MAIRYIMTFRNILETNIILIDIDKVHNWENNGFIQLNRKITWIYKLYRNNPV